MQDNPWAVLVKALTLVLVSDSLTADDKRYISRRLDEEVAELIAGGLEDADEIAKLAVSQTTEKYRQSQTESVAAPEDADDRAPYWLGHIARDNIRPERGGSGDWRL